MLISIEEFLKLRNALPTVDVRSEAEFAAGHMEAAANIPILNNVERVAVGTDYKQRGQAEAIRTGFRLVGPRIIDIVTEAERVAPQKELLVYCWRGGMRSFNFCQFLQMAKLKTHQLKGGYKVYRNHGLELLSTPLQLRVIGGYTGSGKSEILRALRKAGEQIIDLESLANHKGSVFGGLMMPEQPTTEQFQNNLFEALMKLDLTKPIWIEDESITIGKIVIPDPFWKQMCVAPIVEIQVDKLDRIERLVREYGPADKEEFLSAMTGIIKKLGGQHFNAAKEKLQIGDMASTIDVLLTYYDKAYRTGLSKKQHRLAGSVKWDGQNADKIANQLAGTEMISTHRIQAG